MQVFLPLKAGSSETKLAPHHDYTYNLFMKQLANGFSKIIKTKIKNELQLIWFTPLMYLAKDALVYGK